VVEEGREGSEHDLFNTSSSPCSQRKKGDKGGHPYYVFGKGRKKAGLGGGGHLDISREKKKKKKRKKAKYSTCREKEERQKQGTTPSYVLKEGGGLKKGGREGGGKTKGKERKSTVLIGLPKKKGRRTRNPTLDR